MKKMRFALFLVTGCAFLFFSCEVTGKLYSTIPDLVEIAKSNDQGEDDDDQGRKPKPPVVNPPDKDKENKNPPIVVPPETEDDKQGEDKENWDNTGTFWRASWGGALHGLPSDRYDRDILGSIPTKIVITDTAMLHEFFADAHSHSLNEAGNGWVRDERFSDSIAKYDDTFFESRQLATFFLTAGGGGMEFKLGGTTYKDDILNINIDYFPVGAGIAAMIEFFAIVETNKMPADTAVYVNITDWLGRVYTF